jgi:3-(3-hydroxy-phenyl)propionate hydroxylase
MDYLPPLRRYVLEMRYKPMPRYTKGVVVKPTSSRASSVGKLFIQPRVTIADGSTALLDDLLGPRFAVLMWGQDPRLHMNEATRQLWCRLDAQFVTVCPRSQLSGFDHSDGESLIVGDHSEALKHWFDTHNVSIAIVRPDRFVAAATTPAELSDDTNHLYRSMYGISEA